MEVASEERETGEHKMKKLMIALTLTAAGLMAAQTSSAPAAPAKDATAAPATKTAATPKVKKHHKTDGTAKTTAPAAATTNVAPPAAPAK